MIRVAINGFGRIGRNFLRCWIGRENSQLDVVGINEGDNIIYIYGELDPWTAGAVNPGSGQA